VLSSCRRVPVDKLVNFLGARAGGLSAEADKHVEVSGKPQVTFRYDLR